MSNDETGLKKTWTSEKLDWLRCVAVDNQIKPGMFEVAFAVIQHVNARTRLAILSDRTISDATSISTAEVYRHRTGLRMFGWIDWERTRTALRIRPLFDRVGVMLDEIDFRRQVRETERIEARGGSLKRHSRFIAGDETQPASFIAGDYSRIIAGDETRFIAGDEHTPSRYTFSVTPSKELSSKEAVIVEGRKKGQAA